MFQNSENNTTQNQQTYNYNVKEINPIVFIGILILVIIIIILLTARDIVYAPLRLLGLYGNEESFGGTKSKINKQTKRTKKQQNKNK